MKNHSVYFPLHFLLSIFLCTLECQVRLVHFLWDWILDVYKTIQGNRVHKLFTLSVPQLNLQILTHMTLANVHQNGTQKAEVILSRQLKKVWESNENLIWSTEYDKESQPQLLELFLNFIKD